MKLSPLFPLCRARPARPADAVVAYAAGVFELIQKLECGLGILATRAEMIPELRQRHRAVAVDEGKGALDQGTPGFRSEVDAVGNLCHLSQMFQRGERLRIEPVLVGTGRSVRLRPNGGEIVVGRSTPDRVKRHAELWQAKRCAVVDQLPSAGDGCDQVVEESRLGDVQPAPGFLPRQP